MVLPVLDVDPVLGPAGLIRPVAMLRHEPVKAELLRRAEEIRADLAAFERVDENALGSTCE